MNPNIIAMYAEAGINMNGFHIPHVAQMMMPRMSGYQMGVVESRMERCRHLQSEFETHPTWTTAQIEIARLHLCGIMSRLCLIQTYHEFVDSSEEIQNDINYWEAKLDGRSHRFFDDELEEESSDAEEEVRNVEEEQDDDEEAQNEEEEGLNHEEHEQVEGEYESGEETDDDYSSEEEEEYFYRDARRG